MGFMPSEDTSVNQVDFFKIDQDTYDAKTDRWGTHNLMDNNNTRTVTIPSNIKPGTYVVRHEIIGLHFAWQEKSVQGEIGAQPYPNCVSK
jgi:lytic cellulose monooxygenase (C1-hydroxylating)